MTTYQAGAPMERVHLDFLGPLQKTQQGNEYVLMMVDQFTNWVECILSPLQTAEVTAHAAVMEFFDLGVHFKLTPIRAEILKVMSLKQFVIY